MQPFKNLHTLIIEARNRFVSSENDCTLSARLNYTSRLGQIDRLMVNLTDLGFRKGTVSETIVTTYNPDGSCNAAPMGAIMIDEENVSINFYNSSLTLANVKTEKAAVLNLTSDIWIYYKTAFKEVNPEGRLPEDWFTLAEAVKAPKLWSADATVEVKLTDLNSLDYDRTKAVFRVCRVMALQKWPKAYCRGFGVTVEAIIHATRVRELAKSRSERERLKSLLKQIQNCNDVVCHVAPDSSYSDVMEDLMKRIKDWDST